MLCGLFLLAEILRKSEKPKFHFIACDSRLNAFLFRKQEEEFHLRANEWLPRQSRILLLLAREWKKTMKIELISSKNTHFSSLLLHFFYSLIALISGKTTREGQSSKSGRKYTTSSMPNFVSGR
jgi:hypothetical protein